MTEERRPAGRILYFDFLRVLCIFAVVVVHINSPMFHTSPVGTLGWNILNLYHHFTLFCVPVFVMISGAFLLDGSRDYPLKKLYFQKILRLVTALAFWSLLYAAYTSYAGHRSIDAAFFARLIDTAVRGHYHLWFMYMIIGLYIASPILRFVCKSRRAAEYFLALWFVFELVLNLLSVSRRLSPLVSLLRSKAMFHTALGYAGYFVLGHYLTSYRLPSRAVRALYALGAVSYALTLAISFYLCALKGAWAQIPTAYLLPTTAFFSVGVFLFVKRRFESSAPSPRFARALGALSKLCFGAYLSHDVFIILFQKLGILSLNVNPVLSVPLLSLAVTGLSLFAAHLLSKIPVLNRYIL